MLIELDWKSKVIASFFKDIHIQGYISQKCQSVHSEYPLKCIPDQMMKVNCLKDTGESNPLNQA